MKKEKDSRQEKFEKTVKLLKDTHKQVLKENSIKTLNYMLHKIVPEDEQKKVLKAIKDDPSRFLDLDKRLYLDLDFCAEAMLTAQKTYVKSVKEAKAEKDDAEEMVHTFEDSLTQRASKMIVEDLDMEDYKRSERIKGEKLAREVRKEKRIFEERNKGQN